MTNSFAPVFFTGTDGYAIRMSAEVADILFDAVFMMNKMRDDMTTLNCQVGYQSASLYFNGISLCEIPNSPTMEPHSFHPIVGDSPFAEVENCSADVVYAYSGSEPHLSVSCYRMNLGWLLARFFTARIVVNVSNSSGIRSGKIIVSRRKRELEFPIDFFSREIENRLFYVTQIAKAIGCDKIEMSMS